MISLLVSFMPPEGWQLLIVITGLLIMVGCARWGFRLLSRVILLAFFTPFIVNMADQIPLQWRLVLMVISIFFLVGFLLGPRVRDNVISFFVYDLIRLPFCFLGWLLKGSGRRP